MKKTKIATSYHRSGYGRSAIRKATVYLIGEYLYAKDSATARTDMHELQGELKGYVRVSPLYSKLAYNHPDQHYFQVSGHVTGDHIKVI